MMLLIYFLLQAETVPSILSIADNLSLVGFLVIAVWYFTKKEKQQQAKIDQLYDKVLTVEVSATKTISEFTNVMEQLKEALDHNTSVIKELKR